MICVLCINGWQVGEQMGVLQLKTIIKVAEISVTSNVCLNYKNIINKIKYKNLPANSKSFLVEISPLGTSGYEVFEKLLFQKI